MPSLEPISRADLALMVEADAETAAVPIGGGLREIAASLRSQDSGDF